jgi:adenosylcobinamide-GDP ribazoletransferase
MTILPLGHDERLTPDDFGRFPAFYPLVGLTLGAILFLARFVLDFCGFPPATEAVALVALLVILTRGFHLDGIADTMDALLSHRSLEEKLAILKDPHQGTFGVLSIVLDIALKASLIHACLSHPLGVTALILFPAWGRLSTSVVAVFCRYARPSGGLGYYMVERSGARELFLALALAFLMSVWGGWPALFSLLAAVAWGVALIFVWNKTLGGVTGDLLGSTTEISEILTLLFFVLVF